MSVAQLKQSVRQLSPEERRRFFDWMHAYEQELAGAIEPAIDEAWKQETRRRIAEIESGAVQGISGEAVSAKIRQLVGR